MGVPSECMHAESPQSPNSFVGIKAAFPLCSYLALVVWLGNDGRQSKSRSTNVVNQVSHGNIPKWMESFTVVQVNCGMWLSNDSGSSWLRILGEWQLVMHQLPQNTPRVMTLIMYSLFVQAVYLMILQSDVKLPNKKHLHYLPTYHPPTVNFQFRQFFLWTDCRQTKFPPFSISTYRIGKKLKQE